MRLPGLSQLLLLLLAGAAHAWTGLNVTRCGSAHYYPCVGLYTPYGTVTVNGAPVYVLGGDPGAPGFVKTSATGSWALAFPAKPHGPNGPVVSASSRRSRFSHLPSPQGWSDINNFCCAPVFSYY